jgi:hypothetical protein
MKVNLEQLKQNFITIKNIRNKVTNIFQILEEHLKKLKQTYAEFMVNGKQQLFVFGLDSFQFQSKLIDIEYEDMKRLFLAINNRMYCEYYKLYKIIAEYVKENITDKKTLELVKSFNTFPVYKDLEPYKQYNFELIQDLHEDIIILLYEINDFILNKENELQVHKQKQEFGLNINNFVTTFNFNIIMVKEKGMLFISYIDFFHTLHTKYLQRFSMKMNLMYSQVTHDIRFDDSPQPSKIKKEELLNTLQDDNIDKFLIKQIKGSFYDSDSTNSSSLSNLDAIDQQVNSPDNSNNRKEENMYNSPTSKESSKNLSSQTGLSNILKKNIKKVVNGGINIFKNNKKNDGDISSSSSYNDSILTINTFEKKEVLSLKKSNDNILLNISEQHINRHHNSYSSSYSSNDNEYSYNTNIERNKPVSDEDEEELQRTLSSEPIFMEISNQCLEITSPVNSENTKETFNEEVIKDEEKDELKDEEKDELKDQLKDEEKDQLKDELKDQLKEEKDQLKDELKDQLKDELKEEKDELKDQEKQSDDNVSVITIDTFIDQNDDETSKGTEQKKRQYKPRKKKNIC